MQIIKYILVFVAFLVGAVLCWVNSQPITVDYLLGEQEIPLIVLLVVTLLFGFLLAYIAMLPRATRRRAELQRLKRKLHNAEQEVRNLRNLPIQDA